jgi:GTP 3',8-cyclase
MSDLPKPLLYDAFQRKINYLRISVTDRCDFRCIYCMDENTRFVPRAQILTLEEILFIAEVFCRLGVEKIRITGGEPLVRQNILWLFERLGALPGLREVVLTSNGSQMQTFARPLRAAGVKRLNISLDTLRPQRFRDLTRHGNLEQVLAGIEVARAAGFERIKLNTVALRHYNDDEIFDLLEFALARELDITFIEEMPLGLHTPHQRQASHYPSHALRADLARRYTLLPCAIDSGGPARYFQIPGSATRIGFISPHSHNFCATCNRVRLTAEGRLLLCLGQEHSVDLRAVVRANPGDANKLAQIIIQAVQEKPARHEFNLHESLLVRTMNVSGG